MDLERTTRLAGAALANLERHRRRINALNVYPVPDGDTGTNLTLTVRGIVEALERSSATAADELAAQAQRAATMEAKGNSGVILSTIVRGMAPVLAREGALDGPRLAEALRAGTTAAYEAVTHPVEGTMLTVVREMAEEAERPETSTLSFAEALGRAVARGDDAVARTPELLDTLRDAGVVDAGGVGLVELARGVLHELTGEPLPDVPDVVGELTDESIHQEESVLRYCTTFVVEGDDLVREDLEGELERIGDSLLVVGDRTAMKVHVHTDEPGTALAVGTARGTIAGVEIANMHAQTQHREERLLHVVPDVQSEVVAVVVGEGNRRLFESLGATSFVEGGQTMNPSTADLVAAVERTGAAEVVLLPNNSNVIMSAEQAAELAGKPVQVVKSDSIPGGLAAIVSFDPQRSAAENAEEMRETLDAVATGEVTIASRDAQLNGLAVPKGNYLGLAEGEAVSVGEDFERVVNDVVERLLAEPRAVLMLLCGEGAPDVDDLVAAISERHPDVEVDVQEGGQPHYPLLLSAE